MASSVLSPAVLFDRQWFILERWQQYAAEGRANLLRMLAVGGFYTIQLVHFELLAADQQSQQASFHRSATALAVAWTMLVLGVQLCLRRQIFPAALKYISTGVDLLLLTALAMLAGGPGSPMVFAYFLVMTLAALRFELRLVWCATLGALAGYMALVGAADPHWFDADHATPVKTQLVVLLSLALSGTVLGQMVRRMRALADEYARRLQSLTRKND